VPQDVPEGNVWFHASAAELDDTTLRRDSAWWRANDVPAAYLWESRRVPMIVPDVVMAPEELLHNWNVMATALCCVGFGFMLFTFACVSLPRSCISGHRMNLMFGVCFVFFCNPVWLIAWGGYCSFHDCLMSKTSALAIFITGWAIVALAVLAAIVYCTANKRIRR